MRFFHSRSWRRISSPRLLWGVGASIILSAAGCNGGDGGPQPLPTRTATAVATASNTATTAPTATPAAIATPLATQVGVSYSTVRIRALQARGTSAQVRVFFTGSLDAASAARDASFLVTINGNSFAVRQRSYDAASRSVLLQLPSGSFRVSDLIRVAVYDVKDQAGRALFDQQSAPVAAL